MSATAETVSSGKGHRDENFPVASWLIAPHHRPIILAFYRFVRAADDVADHASLPPEEKLALLDRLELTGKRDDVATIICTRAIGVSSTKSLSSKGMLGTMNGAIADGPVAFMPIV